MSRFEFQADANAGSIVEALEEAQALVWPLDKTGDGVPDLLVGYRRRFFLLEVKNPQTENQKKPWKALRPDQVAFHEFFKGFPVFIVFTPAEALAAIGAT